MNHCDDMEAAKAFNDALRRLNDGYQTGHVDGRRYGVSVQRAAGGKVTKLYAEALDGSDHVSFNLFHLADDHDLLKPCEMPAEKVTEFVLGFEND